MKYTVTAPSSGFFPLNDRPSHKHRKISWQLEWLIYFCTWTPSLPCHKSWLTPTYFNLVPSCSDTTTWVPHKLCTSRYRQALLICIALQLTASGGCNFNQPTGILNLKRPIASTAVHLFSITSHHRHWHRNQKSIQAYYDPWEYLGTSELRCKVYSDGRRHVTKHQLKFTAWRTKLPNDKWAYTLHHRRVTKDKCFMERCRLVGVTFHPTANLPPVGKGGGTANNFTSTEAHFKYNVYTKQTWNSWAHTVNSHLC